MDADSHDPGGAEAVTYGTALDHFAESAEVISLIASLPQASKELRSRETSEEKFTAILNKYQEQPHLLDPYLESLVEQLFRLARQSGDDIIVQQQAFRYLYIVSKVRGPKIIVNCFPHEVADLDPVLNLLQKQDPKDYKNWETRYILLLWLSIIIIIPFDLSRMDGGGGSATPAGHPPKTIDRIFEIIKGYIAINDVCREAASFVLAKFISRPDVKVAKMSEFRDWFMQVLKTTDKTSQTNMCALSGVMETLCFLFKHGKREDVLDLAPLVLTQLGEMELGASSNSKLRKLHVKLVKWSGVTFLPPRVATWRYQGGGRSLEEALATPHSTLLSNEVTEPDKEEEEEGYDVPPEMEDVLGLLLSGLQDRDTIVRWTTARGLGKVTGRLPLELADEVVQSLLELFVTRENDGAWHGGCLALAELGRRGLLLPQRLSDVVPVLLKALSYDERRGSCSVGAHVRDAACYVCWSFARAYQPKDLKPYVTAIASGLLVTMLFDREVNCRKAASAAFQENVGRQRIFPHGIEILTAADYFTLGSMMNAYLNISVQVAVFPEYTRPLIDHLVQSKLYHWDSAVREMAAKALHNLTPLDSPYTRDNILPSLVPLVTSPDPCLRHGALRALSEICSALNEVAKDEATSFSQYVGSEVICTLLAITSRLQDARVFRGAVGEIMRPAVLKFIEVMCLCEVLAEKEILEVWQSLVDENLVHTEEDIRKDAVSAFSGLCLKYYSLDSDTVRASQDKLIPLYTSQLTNPSPFIQMGHALALGYFPKCMLVGGRLNDVMGPLIKMCSSITSTNPLYAEARRDAVTSLTRLCCTVGSCDEAQGSCDVSLSVEDVGAVFGAFSCCLGDYTRDSRGDIGAGVREAAMSGLETWITTISTHLLTPDIVGGAVCGLVQQANEKIDRTRALACEALVGVAFHEPALPHIPHHSELKEVFKSVVGGVANFSVPRVTFPLTVQLLGLPWYRYPTLLGLLVSVGGLTESTVRESSASLLRHLGKSAQELDVFAELLLRIFKDHSGEARVVIPLLKTLDLLFSNGIFDVYTSSENPSFPMALLNLLEPELKRSRDPIKILASVNVYCGLLQFPSVRRPVLIHIMLLLCHTFPRVRKLTADQFYVTLLTFDEILEPDLIDTVMAILSDNAWDGPLAGVREKRNTLCDTLQLPVPKMVPGGKNKAKKTPKDDLASYKDLVDRAGY